MILSISLILGHRGFFHLFFFVGLLIDINIKYSERLVDFRYYNF